ncbi:hypothetical protein FQ154_13785 [Paeniglutamicibacter gangotriensis]|uniref:Uncharacterized protein n=1 Tax=Paeniglutamicibacter gangotriensis TaxID=254787 RepID=A0A5B0EBN6_9MICC|nr:hypothetical protein [Paeniglutamicibacter gangotriensis]KAA0975271.1 hypothetical protein FQ154_13785 [Paeniglutamicibacter gangotriensis]
MSKTATQDEGVAGDQPRDEVPLDRDPRWAKQFGDFGEHLVMYIVGIQKGLKVAVVDHAGADLIATDRTGENGRYAISVKSKTLNIRRRETTIGVESRLFRFEQRDVEHLREFADSFGMTPVVAFVIVWPSVPQDHPDWIKKQARYVKDGKTGFKTMERPEIGVFIVNLDDAIAMGQDASFPYVTAQGGGFNFKFEDVYFEKLIADPRVDYTRLTLAEMGPVRGWDRSA